jgi:hypothetical protein
MKMEIGFAWLLGLVFVVLRLCHVVAWSWWWVTLPFWVAPAILFAVMAFALFMACVCEVIDWRAAKKRRR